MFFVAEGNLAAAEIRSDWRILGPSVRRRHGRRREDDSFIVFLAVGRGYSAERRTRPFRVHVVAPAKRCPAQT